MAGDRVVYGIPAIGPVLELTRTSKGSRILVTREARLCSVGSGRGAGEGHARRETPVCDVGGAAYIQRERQEVHCLDMTPQDICRRPWRTREP